MSGLISNSELYEMLQTVNSKLDKLLKQQDSASMDCISLTELAKHCGWGTEKTRRMVIEKGLRYFRSQVPVRSASGTKMRDTMTIVKADVPLLFKANELPEAGTPVININSADRLLEKYFGKSKRKLNKVG
jgi:hypothetical protein